MSDDVIECFIESCLTESFHHLSADDNDVDNDESVLMLCEAVLAGIGDVAMLPCDCLSPSQRSLIVSKFTTICQLLPTPHQVALLV